MLHVLTHGWRLSPLALGLLLSLTIAGCFAARREINLMSRLRRAHAWWKRWTNDEAAAEYEYEQLRQQVLGR